MAAGGITGKAFTLASLFGDRTTYSIEYYQREYAWTAEDVRTLLSDLVEEFEGADDGRRSRRAKPQQFFLGPFVYADVDGGYRRFLVDGQQRFTTLHLIFLHLLRLMPDDAGRKTKHRLDDAIIVGYTGKKPVFRLDIEERQKPLEALLDGRDYDVQFGDSLSVQTLLQRSTQIEEELTQRLDSDHHAQFVDWLLDNVVMVGIQAVDKDNGFRIFESMNDRGARLTSVDLIKSYLLSRAKRDEEKLNIRWRDMLAEVTRRRGDSDAPRDFLRAFLIARHANLNNDSRDADEIRQAPHEWTRRNAGRIGLKESDGETYLDFVTELIDFGKHYATLAAATSIPREDEQLATLFYNHVNGVTAQTALILAAIGRHDTLTTMKDKARVVANYVDLLYVMRAIHDESTRPEDLNRTVLSLIPLVRDSISAIELGATLGTTLPPLDFDVMMTFGARGDNRAQIRYLLARLTAYIEQEMGRPNEIQQYLSPERTWQIEHIFADHPERHPGMTPLEFRLTRNRLGGLGLLPASDNASVRDLEYAEKSPWYRRHTTVLAILATGYNKRNPRLKVLRQTHDVERTLRDFGSSPAIADVVTVRGELYRSLARHIWDPARLGLLLPPADEAKKPTNAADEVMQERALPKRPAPMRRSRRTDIAILIGDGRLKPGDQLHGNYRGTRHVARVDAEGLLWLSPSDSFRLPDEAGKMATNRKTCTGMTFWHVTLIDGTAVPLRQFRDDPTLAAR